MGMSAAERMRKYLENMKNDPAKYAQYLNKEKQRYKKRKKTGELRSISACNDREKRAIRKKWQNAKRNN